MGKTLVVVGVVIVVVGLLLMLGERSRIPFGRLPGDIKVFTRNGTFYFPLGTSILLSIVLTVVLWLLGRRG